MCHYRLEYLHNESLLKGYYRFSMKGLPVKIDFSPLVGRVIDWMRLGKFQVHYFLSDEKPKKPDIWIEIESSAIFTDSNGKSTEIDDFRAGGGLLCLLLGLTIESASRRDDGGLILNMSTGIRLEVVNDTPMYESIVLHIGEEIIVG